MLKKSLTAIAITGLYASDAAAPTQYETAEPVSLTMPEAQPLETPMTGKVTLSEGLKIDITDLIRYTIAEKCPDGFTYKARFHEQTEGGRTFLLPAVETYCSTSDQAKEGAAEARFISDAVTGVIQNEYPCFEENTRIVVHGKGENIEIDEEASQIKGCSTRKFSTPYLSPSGNLCLASEMPESGWESINETLKLSN